VGNVAASITPRELWWWLGARWKELGVRWGGSFKVEDVTHFELF